MKTSNFITLFALIAIISFSSCKKEDAKVLKATLSANTVSDKSGEVTIQVTSNTEWQISSSSWLTLSQASGKNDALLTGSYTANPETKKRTAKIIISGSDVETLNLELTQDALKLADCEAKKYGYVDFYNYSSNPYAVYIDGKKKFTLQGSSGKTDYQVNSGKHTFKVEQQSGYVFYPTIKEYSKTIENCKTQSVSFP